MNPEIQPDRRNNPESNEGFFTPASVSIGSYCFAAANLYFGVKEKNIGNLALAVVWAQVGATASLMAIGTGVDYDDKDFRNEKVE